jgi:hypothetical protein
MDANKSQSSDWILLNRPFKTTSRRALRVFRGFNTTSVKAGIVEKPEDYLLSSARDYFGMKGLLAIEHLTAGYILRS